MTVVLDRRRAVALARHYPRGRGPLDRPDRRSPRPLAGDDQGVLLRPDRREGAGGQGALRRACAAAAARTRSRATARATRTRTARPAIPGAIERRWTRERVLDAMRDWRAATGGCRRPTTGRARTRAGAGERRSSGSPRESGRRRASSPACSALGLPLARWLRSGPGRSTTESAAATSSIGSESISLPKPRQSAAKSAHEIRSRVAVGESRCALRFKIPAHKPLPAPRARGGRHDRDPIDAECAWLVWASYSGVAGSG